MSTVYNRWPSSSGVSTPIPINQGGTGQTSQQAAINALTGTQSSGKYLRSNGTNATLSSLAAADMTGAIAITNGGTGQTTANTALNALLPTQTSQSGKFLTTDGTNTSWATGGGGGGFVAEVHIGPQCTTQSSTISATSTFTTFSNSPTLTFTPTNSGTFRVTFAPPLLTDNAADVAKCQVILTAGAGATILAQTIGVINNSSAGGTGILTCYTEAIYTLVAGTSYSFDAQGCTVAGAGDTEIRCNWGPANIVAVRIA